MKNRGFTLIELLAVVVILAVIALITVPVVGNVIGGAKETIYQKNINTILGAAYDWSLENPSFLPEINKSTYITLGALKSKGYIESNVKNTLDDTEFPNELVVQITNVKGKDIYERSYSKKSGDYLYTLLIDELNSSQYQSYKPELVFNDVDLSDGVYVLNAELGEPFVEPSYTVNINSSSEEVRYEVTVNIMKKTVSVSSVDTSGLGIYNLYYTVIDELGYASTTKLNVIVKDTTAPTLTIPENAVISLSDTEYDLMDGASCTDNSGNCNINISGDITFGVADSYVVTYIASDPSGNTISQNRTIRVE